MAAIPLNRGFSLPELLCALAIAALLLGIALPVHQQHRHRVERVQAARALEGAATCLATNESLDRMIGAANCLPTPTGAYRFELAPTSGGWMEGHEWRAEPRGGQRGDRCGTLVLDHDGRRTVTGTDRDADACWRGR